MPNKPDFEEFPPEIRAAFDAYPTPRPSRGFEARFWAQLEARRNRYRGFGGFLRRVWEIEIEGVAVWRLALSTLSGGASCALFFAAFALLAMPDQTPRAAPESPPDFPDTPRMAFDARAFYAREWEEFGFPARSKPAPQPLEIPQDGGEISCFPSKNGWV